MRSLFPIRKKKKCQYFKNGELWGQNSIHIYSSLTYILKRIDKIWIADNVWIVMSLRFLKDKILILNSYNLSHSHWQLFLYIDNINISFYNVRYLEKSTR